MEASCSSPHRRNPLSPIHTHPCPRQLPVRPGKRRVCVHRYQKIGLGPSISADVVRVTPRYCFKLLNLPCSLFKLPSRAPDWNFDRAKHWAPGSHLRKTVQPAEVIVIRTSLKLERTGALPFTKSQQKKYTQQERLFADKAVVPKDFSDFKDKVCSFTFLSI